jgi:hypothetical protein
MPVCIHIHKYSYNCLYVNTVLQNRYAIDLWRNLTVAMHVCFSCFLRETGLSGTCFLMRGLPV